MCWGGYARQVEKHCFVSLGVNCALRAGDEHYALRCPGGCLTSQLSFKPNQKGIRCLVYREHSVTKTNRGGLRDMKKERKIVWIKPNSNPSRCPVRIVEKYIKLLPTTGSKPNLYLHSLKAPKPSLWYCEVPLGINKVRSVVSEMLKDAGLDGFFTNHSLRHTAATRLFQAGKNVKLIKEVTGHVSNAVEKYEMNSDSQRMEVSSIIQGEQIEVEKVAPVMSNCVKQQENVSNVTPIELKLHSLSGSNDRNETITNAITAAVNATGY